MTLRGYADPESSRLGALPEVNDVEIFSDLGPAVNHFYEVSNFGPFDIGKIYVSIASIACTVILHWLIKFLYN